MLLSTLENGKILKTPCRSINFDYHCDVLCVGAGTAGVYAADSAAREGADVILCELGENIGGMHTAGNVTSYYYGAPGGSYEESDRRSRADTVFFDNMRHWEQRQIRMTERLLESGVRLLCRHSVLGLYFEDSRVVGILAFDGQKRVSVRAEITVDATSDGHLIRMTDVHKRYGRPSDSSFVPFGVFLQYVKNGRLYSKNNDSGIMNHYSLADFSKKTIMAHANAAYILEMGESVNCALHTGVREGLSYEGEESLKYEDVLLEHRPEKILFWAYSDLDRHGSLRASEEEMFQNWWVISNLSTVVVSIPVPMGSVVPKGIRGLVSVGRLLSCDTYIQSAVRMNRDMFRMGECVGVAAAMAAMGKVDFLDIDYADFLARVKKRGCFGGYSDRAFGFDNTYSAYLTKMKSLGRTPDKKYEGLALGDHLYEPIEFDVDKSFHLLKTDAPGVAIWSCYLSESREEVGERLYKELCLAEDTLYKYNCAIALGLLGDLRALPMLCHIVENRDCFFFTDNRRSNQFRSAVALCLIGRLGTEGELPLIFDVLSEREIERPMYHTLSANYLYHAVPDRNFVYFAMLTHACVAAYGIYRRCGLEMEKLHSFFAKLFADGTVLRHLTDTSPGEAAHEEISGFIEYLLKVTNN